MTSADLHTLTGAYALHALSDRESEEFARHLAVCPSCAQEVRELQETAARLGLAAAEVPTPEFRARVMAALPEVRQLPPLVPEASDLSSWRLRRLRWQRRMPQLAVAACLLIALVAGGIAVNAQHEATQQRSRTAQVEQQAEALSALLAAPDASFRTGAVKGGGSSTVVTSRALGQTAFVYHGLPLLPDAHVYELWFSKGGQMVPAGLVPATPAAGAQVLAGAQLLVGTSNGAAGVGVTVEPAGGSPKPTSAPVMLVSI
ncbi:hypothetical protein ABIA33_007229 [Streptacidiphilus sp. MAP12-16]|uniref:anti-sigma factor n=1 Tax=Streptacidiphilus sp. MAP12-16 TaxID=3156300 RepID=UPI003515DA21